MISSLSVLNLEDKNQAEANTKKNFEYLYMAIIIWQNDQIWLFVLENF